MKSVLEPIFPYVLTVPAGTPAESPLEVEIPTDNLILVAVDLQIPNGHVGATGFALWYGPAIVLPWTAGTGWISGDNLVTQFPVGLEIGPTPLTARLYNIGSHVHSFYVRLRCKYLPAVVQNPAPLALVADTSSAA